MDRERLPQPSRVRVEQVVARVAPRVAGSAASPSGATSVRTSAAQVTSSAPLAAIQWWHPAEVGLVTGPGTAM